MVVCSFYLQGRCMYGDSCRYEHPRHQRQWVQEPSAPRPLLATPAYPPDYRYYSNNYQYQPPPPQYRAGFQPEVVKNRSRFETAVTKAPAPSSFLQTKNYEYLVQEVIFAEKGNQWPLSCYGPFKDHPNIPTLEDISPEELRNVYYQKKDSTKGLAEYESYSKMLHEKADYIKKFLKTPSQELEKMLTDITSKENPQVLPATSQATNSFSTFKFAVDGPSSSSGAPLDQNKNAEMQKPLSQSSSIFGGPSTSGPTSYNNIFSQSSTSSSPSFNVFTGKTGGDRTVRQDTQTTSTAEPDFLVYSKEEDLTEEERRSFLESAFLFGQIPLKPPTRALS